MWLHSTRWNCKLGNSDSAPTTNHSLHWKTCKSLKCHFFFLRISIFIVLLFRLCLHNWHLFLSITSKILEMHIFLSKITTTICHKPILEKFNLIKCFKVFQLRAHIYQARSLLGKSYLSFPIRLILISKCRSWQFWFIWSICKDFCLWQLSNNPGEYYSYIRDMGHCTVCPLFHWISE